MASTKKSAEWWFIEAMRCERLMNQFRPNSPWHVSYRDQMEVALRAAATIEREKAK